VQIWTHKYDIFSKKYIIIPIHEKCVLTFSYPITIQHLLFLAVLIGSLPSYLIWD
ncbi:hypothetical protein K439DRAFT_1333803, partial [Ramaria rubella]